MRDASPRRRDSCNGPWNVKGYPRWRPLFKPKRNARAPRSRLRRPKTVGNASALRRLQRQREVGRRRTRRDRAVGRALLQHGRGHRELRPLGEGRIREGVALGLRRCHWRRLDR